MAVAALALAGCSHPVLQESSGEIERESVMSLVHEQAPPAVLEETPDKGTEIQFQNVHLSVAPHIALDVRHLRGRMRPIDGSGPVLFDDKRSFIIHLTRATIALSPSGLEHLLNDHVFGYEGAPLRNLRVRFTAPYLVQQGLLHKVVDIPFEITALPSVSSDGEIRIHPVAMRIFNVDGSGLMKSLHMTLEKMLDLHRAVGVRAEENDLLLDPAKILPPPRIEGRIASVGVTDGMLVQTFVDSSAPPSEVAALKPPADSEPNYMYFHGGTLRFGKLFMVHADMQLVDSDPRDPFTFSVDEYNRQLVAGYSKNTPAMGLEVYMPDLDKTDRPLDPTTLRRERQIAHDGAPAPSRAP